MKGTFGYRAPEVEAGGAPNEASDVYAFGALLLWMHTRQLPVQATQGVLRSTMVPALDELLPRLLHPDPSQRPTASSLLASP